MFRSTAPVLPHTLARAPHGPLEYETFWTVLINTMGLPSVIAALRKAGGEPFSGTDVSIEFLTPNPG